MIEIFTPKSKRLSTIRSWEISPHRVRDTIRYEAGHWSPCCVKCEKEIQDGDLAFYCITRPIRIRGYASPRKVCCDCGIELLKKFTPEKQIENFNKYFLKAKAEGV